MSERKSYSNSFKDILKQTFRFGKIFSNQSLSFSMMKQMIFADVDAMPSTRVSASRPVRMV